jgi:hypothetical protein
MSDDQITAAAERAILRTDGLPDEQRKRAVVADAWESCAATEIARPHDWGSILRLVWARMGWT